MYYYHHTRKFRRTRIWTIASRFVTSRSLRITSVGHVLPDTLHSITLCILWCRLRLRDIVSFQLRFLRPAVFHMKSYIFFFLSKKCRKNVSVIKFECQNYAWSVHAKQTFKMSKRRFRNIRIRSIKIGRIVSQHYLGYAGKIPSDLKIFPKNVHTFV